MCDSFDSVVTLREGAGQRQQRLRRKRAAQRVKNHIRFSETNIDNTQSVISTTLDKVLIDSFLKSALIEAVFFIFYFFLERSPISIDWTDCFSVICVYYDSCGAWVRVPSLLVHKWFSMLSGDTVHLILIWSFKHSNTMVTEPVTSSLNTVGKCKVLLDKEISISTSASLHSCVSESRRAGVQETMTVQ